MGTSVAYEAYNLPVERLEAFYHKLNQPILYADGMVTSLGIIYWGREEHADEIQHAIPRLIEQGALRFDDVLQATRTPARAKKHLEIFTVQW
ncbi:MAG: hypothetical protein JW726_10295 [Anaerolineales bacterium]|nr:hypothetical protein [Anaerolineales bacterium]